MRFSFLSLARFFSERGLFAIDFFTIFVGTFDQVKAFATNIEYLGDFFSVYLSVEVIPSSLNGSTVVPFGEFKESSV